MLQRIVMLLIFWFQVEVDYKGDLGRPAKVYKPLAETNRRLIVLSIASNLLCLGGSDWMSVFLAMDVSLGLIEAQSIFNSLTQPQLWKICKLRHI